MPAPIALQLYTLREAAAADYEATVRKVAEIGYVGVEPAGFPGTTVEAGKKLFDELGLQVCSAHLPLPVGDKLQESLETAAALGVTRVVAGQGPDQFASKDLIREACDRFNEASANCAEKGLTFAIHNHWWESVEVEGAIVYQHMLKYLAPEVLFQVDAYWVQTAGPDPAGVIAELGQRAPLIPHCASTTCHMDMAGNMVNLAAWLGGAATIPQSSPGCAPPSPATSMSPQARCRGIATDPTRALGG